MAESADITAGPARKPGRPREAKITLDALVKRLLEDQMILPEESQTLTQRAAMQRKDQIDVHPLIWLAERHLKSSRPPHKELGLEELTRWLAGVVRLPYFRIDPLSIDVDKVTAVLPRAYAVRYGILPVEVTDDYVVFATAEPFVREWEGEMANVLRKQIRRVVANPAEIVRYQGDFYGISRSLQQASRLGAEAAPALTNLEALVEMGRAGKLDANDHHVVSIVDWLLQFAFDQRASDIHLEPRRNASHIRLRIDGNLHTVYEMPTPVLGAVTARIKALGRMDIIEKRRPQDGRLKTKTPSGREVEMRLSTMPTAFGEKMVMRIFDPEVVARNADELGLGLGDAMRWREMCRQSHGIILVTGPTGSGKTTTLYATLKFLASPDVNLCTIEDPIEMVEPLFNQMQVNPAIGVDFATGVRTLMRQDPDIIMVGEIRDLETAQMAIQASLTGHLVFSTLHTNDAPSALTRLMDLGVPPYLINATLLGVVAQRLVRTLCPHCQKEVPLDLRAWESLTHPWGIVPPPSAVECEGCHECRKTGFRGRMGLYEMLRMSPEIRALVKPECSIDEIRRVAVQQGMELLRISGARKVAAGVTTIEEVLRVTPSANEL